jgi:nitrite reductase/ring-hydroxylating ferredoxin subunit
MERRRFLRVGGLACMAGVALSAVSVGCASARCIDGTIEGEDLRIPLASLMSTDGSPLKSVVVRHVSLKWPVALYATADGGYRALLMRCTHQNAQLKAGDGELTCPAHGSAFTSDGTVMNGPAEQPLRRFPTRLEGDALLISLKA